LGRRQDCARFYCWSVLRYLGVPGAQPFLPRQNLDCPSLFRTKWSSCGLKRNDLDGRIPPIHCQPKPHDATWWALIVRRMRRGFSATGVVVSAGCCALRPQSGPPRYDTGAKHHQRPFRVRDSQPRGTTRRHMVGTDREENAIDAEPEPEPGLEAAPAAVARGADSCEWQAHAMMSSLASVQEDSCSISVQLLAPHLRTSRASSASSAGDQPPVLPFNLLSPPVLLLLRWTGGFFGLSSGSHSAVFPPAPRATLPLFSAHPAPRGPSALPSRRLKRAPPTAS
jgi:hypothetical protein